MNTEKKELQNLLRRSLFREARNSGSNNYIPKDARTK
jgi:hypothetical protein